MLLILLSWTYIFFSTVNLGVAFKKMFKVDNDSLVATSLFGLLTATLLGSLCAFFIRINFEFHVALLILNVWIFFGFKTSVLEIYYQCRSTFLQLSIGIKILLILVSILIIAQCSSMPYAVDNESYYIQTIKWINEYGFVKGLANLHIFLGQTSGWHVTQSVFSFSFLYGSFNDLSGFCLLLANVFALNRLDRFLKFRLKHDLIIGLFPLANVLLFQFIGAPSPDIPIYVLTLVMTAFFLNTDRTNDIQTFKILSVLALFALYIKPTSLALAAFPLLLLLRNFHGMVPRLHRIILLAAFVLMLFLAKNFVISGHALFPVASVQFSPLWQVPAQIVRFYFIETKLFAFKIPEDVYNQLSLLQLFKHRLLLPKLHGWFNCLSILLIVVSPLLIKRFFNHRKYWMLYGIMCLQMLLLFASSPQYRFFLNFIMVFSFLFIACFVSNRKLIMIGIYLSSAIAAATLFIPMDLSAFTKNPMADSNSVFSVKQFLEPHPNSKIPTISEKVNLVKLTYYSPAANSFFWGSGDLPVPAVNKVQLDYFEKRFGVIPQPMTENLKDGFYAVKTR